MFDDLFKDILEGPSPKEVSEEAKVRESAKRLWPRQLDMPAVVSLDPLPAPTDLRLRASVDSIVQQLLPSVPGTTTDASGDSRAQEPLEFDEVEALEECGDSCNSTSVHRAWDTHALWQQAIQGISYVSNPAAGGQEAGGPMVVVDRDNLFTQGSSQNYPFMPGGMSKAKKGDTDANTDDDVYSATLTAGDSQRKKRVKKTLPEGFWDGEFADDKKNCGFAETISGTDVLENNKDLPKELEYLITHGIDFETPHLDVPLSSIEMRQNMEAEAAKAKETTEDGEGAEDDDEEDREISMDDLDNVEVSQETGKKKLRIVRKNKAKSAANAFKVDAGMFSSGKSKFLDDEDDYDEDSDSDSDEISSKESSESALGDAEGKDKEQGAGEGRGEGGEEEDDDAEDKELDGLLTELSNQKDTVASGQDATFNKAPTEWSAIDTTDVSDFKSLVPTMAIEYPFELDDFQKRAIYRLERNENVFVAAHTSAGKTVAAEYAIALAAKHMTRAIYTSPIKALSNQKFRDFKEKFGSVGLITGDVSINPEASCLILTTEILRSMLYRGADIIRDIEWVIFDEVHYVNDAERGVVWEEVIIMLPDHVNMIMLSATVPNALEFADWIGRTKQKKMHVISTLKRPVPLEHYIYTGNETTYKIVDDKRTFNKVEYQKAVDSVKGGKGGDQKGQKRWDGNENWTKPVRFLQKHDLLPTVVFVFSKRNVERYAYSISGVDLTNSVAEKNEIHHFIDSSLCRLKECDRELPQILRIRELLKRGIGIHHGGLLPIVKEIVEMLFARGLIKVLFATETFAMGVNMPARSVMFAKVRKHDGTSLRDLLPGEYTQMSGRAGRRGKDPAGTVLLNFMQGVPDAADLFQLILGTPTRLESKFRLTYNMILNLLRIEDLKVEDMMKRSFAESSFQKTIPRQQQLLIRAEAKLARMKNPECLHEGEFPVCPIEDYASAVSACELLDKQIRTHILYSTQAQQFLQLGRAVALQHPRLYPVLTYGAIISTEMTDDHGLEFKLVVIDPKTRECSVQKGVRSSCIQGILKQTIGIDTLIEYGGPLAAKSMGVATRSLSRLLDGKGVNMLSPEKDLKITDIDFVDLVMQRKEAEEILPTSPCHACPRRIEHLTQALKREKLRKKVDKLRFSLSDQNLQQMPDFQQRLEVLKALGYVSPDLTVELKGRVAREISTCNEVVLTEMIFKNVFTALNPPEFVSLLSTFVCQEKNAALVTESFSPRLVELWNYALAEVKNVAEVQNECGMVTDPEVMVTETICPAIMNVVYQWACQVPFKELCTLTDVQEGSIVRYIVRLEETCKEIRSAARVIGDPTLYKLAETASTLIKRDIVFAASLYIK